jgi:endonuclease G, mitochondrial
MQGFRVILCAIMLVVTGCEPDPIGVPYSPFEDEIVRHKGYTLGYSEEHEQARWVAYELTEVEVKGQVERTDNFRIDPNVSTGSSAPSDYSHSGFDRGHLAPAADMKLSKDYMDESFYMSNISPQVPSFNRGMWKRLENQVREFAVRYNAIYVVTGPVFMPSDSTIGLNGVTVPSYFYKVLLAMHDSDVMAIGFILPNRDVRETLELHATSVDAVEEATGLDFFVELQNRTEDKVESSFDYGRWMAIGNSYGLE